MEPLIINSLRLSPGYTESELLEKISSQTSLSVSDLRQAGYRILQKSIDARRKNNISVVLAVEISPSQDKLTGIDAILPVIRLRNKKKKPVIVGAGPAGLFAALFLAGAGCEPILLEQGESVEHRVRQVNEFWKAGKLDTLSNVQFGEGGAGTFSDGKLTTNIKNPLCRIVLEEMVLAGAPEEILYLSKPHIGTDKLRGMVMNMRQKIIAAGGQILFASELTGFEHSNNRLRAVYGKQRHGSMGIKELVLDTEHLILAAGHSAREIFAMLHTQGIKLLSKPFSLGVRIEHRQKDIDNSQYKNFSGNPGLPPAEYKLACHLPDGRTVYTFCMCPGGQVIAAASEKKALVVNGMSYYSRDGRNANSALLVSVTPDDFPDKSPLGGMFWQREFEEKAYDLGGGNYLAPCQTLADFCGLKPAKDFNPVQPSYRPGISWQDISHCLPGFVTTALRTALPEIEKKMHGFADPGAVLTAVESRSSSPVRICRDDNLEASIKGIYPCGEGAGYAGGIMSAAVDGLRCAKAVLSCLS